jgi:signal transduction histidine kinase
LDDVIQRVAQTMSFPLQQHGISLHLDLDPAIPSVVADKDAIEQAVLNLLHNAMKYTGDSRDIEIVLKKDGDFAVISVADHGFGIRDEDRARIFEKFVRIESPQNARIPGTGLGLTIVRHIAEAHGGRIEVESRPGQGSTFSFRIPMEEGGR